MSQVAIDKIRAVYERNEGGPSRSAHCEVTYIGRVGGLILFTRLEPARLPHSRPQYLDVWQEEWNGFDGSHSNAKFLFTLTERESLALSAMIGRSP